MKLGSVQTKSSRFLLSYSTTPHTTTGVPPSQLLMKRKPRVLLNLLQPDIRERVRTKQSQQKTRHDYHARERELPLEEAVYARDFRQKKAWVPGTIIKKSGPVSAEVQLEMVQSSDVIRITYAVVLIQDDKEEQLNILPEYKIIFCTPEGISFAGKIGIPFLLSYHL
ncbi:hypothetical protein QZH41_001352 [Actinostola sp. cb2023]|nr:hypothetical protein QZH41_001352 [Actinostola sp. cb2023]